MDDTYDFSVSDLTVSPITVYQGRSCTVSFISDNWNHAKHTRMPARKAYYISAEYLIGRLVYSNLYNLGILDEMKQLFAQRGVDLAVLEDIEDAALGNGGLGRLAACFLESLSTLALPAYGCGIRYHYGIFEQRIENGYQVEAPDNWLENGNVWEVPSPDDSVVVNFGNMDKIVRIDFNSRSAWIEAGVKVVPVVPSVAIARRVERGGATAVIAEGTESGGHVGELTTMALVPQIVDAVKIPVIGMGGVSSAEDVIEMMLAGATAVEIGAANLVNPFVCRDIIRDLPTVMDRYGINTLNEIIGGAK